MTVEERAAILKKQHAAILRSTRLIAQAKGLSDVAVALRHETALCRRRQFTVVIRGSGLDGADIAAISAKVSGGELPRTIPAKTFYGRGLGNICCACDRVVGTHEIEVEADFDGVAVGIVTTLRFHSDCFREWRKARNAALLQGVAEGPQRHLGA